MFSTDHGYRELYGVEELLQQESFLVYLWHQ